MDAASFLPAEAGPALVPRIGDIEHAGMDADTSAWSAFDISGARGVIARIVAGEAPDDWVRALLDAVRFADVDENALRTLGPAGGRRRMVGQPLTAYWPPESWPTLAELILAATADFPRGAARTRKIASSAFADATANISTDPTHPDLVFVSVGGDVIDERSLWTLRASEERYRTLIHHLPWALVLVDSTAMLPIFDELRRAGVTDIAPYLEANPNLPSHSRAIVRVTEANRNAVELFGADGVERLIGPVDYLFAASPDSAKRVITAHFDRRRNHTEIMKLRTFDGRLRDVQLSVTYPTPPERLDVTLLMFEDVTERLRTETQLRQLQADYSRAARIATLGELASSIAHEVNQPLSAILMNAETSLRWLARDDPNLAKVAQLTARIADSARHASGIVQRIRGMAARHAPESGRLDLNRVVEEALLFVCHDIEARAITLSVRLDIGVPRVLGDRVQLQQVIVNLLINGLQAIGQDHAGNGRIELATGKDSDGVVFTIRDNGSGIAEADRDRIFDGFFTTKPDGMGIGLAICQSIIATHGGTIAVSNHPEGGAIFRVALPALES